MSKNYKLPKSYDWTNAYTMKQMTVTIGIYDYRNDDSDTTHNGVTYGSPPKDKYEAYGYEVMYDDDVDRVYGWYVDTLSINPNAETPDYQQTYLSDVLEPVVEFSQEYIAAGYDDYYIVPELGDLHVNKRDLHVTAHNQENEYTGSPIRYPQQNGDGEVHWKYSNPDDNVIDGDSVGITLIFDNVTPQDAGLYEDAIVAVFYNLDEYADNGNYRIVMDGGNADFTVTPQKVLLVIEPYNGTYTGTVVDTPYTGYTIRTSSGTLSAEIAWGEFTYTLNGDDAESILDAGEYTVHYSANLKNYALYDSADDIVPNAGTFTVTINQAENWWISSTDHTETGWKIEYQYGGYTYNKSPVLPTGSFTSHFSDDVEVEFYEGQNSNGKYLGTLGDPDHPWEFTNTTPSGYYTVLVKVPGNTNYKVLSTEYTIYIERATLNVHWSVEVTYLAKGESATNTLVNYDPELMRPTLSNATIDDDGAVTVTELGTYSAILTLTDESFENYIWEGRPDDQSIECTW